ncbi:aminoglycoside phosphotransferase family protein [Microlunatus endophyticus]|nr:aminoglycoside phosphotransferase family protein [Microlunatus endophyticus]
MDNKRSQIDRYLADWNLQLEGEPWTTPSSELSRVQSFDHGACILKIPFDDEERAGSRVLMWWEGDGAAPVYAIAPDGAILMQRADPGTPLLEAAKAAEPPDYAADVDATRQLIAVAQRLHAHGGARPDGLRSLRSWFRGLFAWAEMAGGFYARAAQVAEQLLADQHGDVVLHGDLHHENVLWFGPERGWLAIDPKGIYGDPAFDFATLLTNPDCDVILRPGRLERQAEVISDSTGISGDRLLRWTVAWAGLSVAWHQQPEPVGRARGVLEVGQRADNLLR